MALKQVGSLWQNKSKSDGATYFSGMFDGDKYLLKEMTGAEVLEALQKKVMIFKNKDRKTEKHPGWKLYIEVEGKKKEEPAAPPDDEPLDPDSDDIPF